MNTLTLRRFDDMHVHLRTGDMLKSVLPHTHRYADRAVIMPNTAPIAMLTGGDVMGYRLEILQAQANLQPKDRLTPLMTIAIRDTTTPKIIADAAKAGAIAGKIYPLGVTTNAENGLRHFDSPWILDSFRAMRDLGMTLLIHGEIDEPDVLVTKRELAFLPNLLMLTVTIPGLKIVLEHVSTKAGVDLVRSLGDNVAATITAHHLCLTLNDVIGSGIKPHHMCMPVPKDFTDRQALIEAATSGEPKFFLGSDSAPHARTKKECAHGACGVFTAPVLPEVLAEVFEQHDKLDRLENFTSKYGAEFYGLPLNESTITLKKEPWAVPDEYDGIVPFRAGTTLTWKQVD